MHACMCVHKCITMYVCLHECVCVSVYVCVCVCVRVRVCVSHCLPTAPTASPSLSLSLSPATR